MATDFASLLNPEKALVFRLTHVQNLPWIFRNGLHCRNTDIQDPAFLQIGLDNVIERRKSRAVPIAPGGTLADYVPFYFTPMSMMAFNIHTGHNGVNQHSNENLAFVVASMYRLKQEGLPVLFTDRHALLHATSFFADFRELDRINWPILQSRDFRLDADHPAKAEQYQAEALVHRTVPIHLIEGVACYSAAVRDSLLQEAVAGRTVPIVQRPQWYF